jgi:hypothetical protein
MKTLVSVSKLSGREAEADYVEKAAPRLVRVTAITATSFALFEGGNRALCDPQVGCEDVREIAKGYIDDTVSMTAVRLSLLLDADPNVISFQTVYRRLNRPVVIDVLVRRARDRAEALEDRTEENIRASVASFLKTYRAIDWRSLHGRLQHFRNHGLAHLLPQPIKKRPSYGEIGALVRSVTRMGECLVSFDPNGVPLRVDEIAEWSNRAKATWEAAFQREGVPMDNGD